MIIAAASKNPAKIQAVRNAAEIYWDNYEIISVAVPSEVSNMPFSKKETRKGAINRVNNVMKHSNPDLAVAHEGGVCIIEGEMYLFSSCVATDGKTHAFGGETLIRLPASVRDELNNGGELELGDIIERETGMPDARKKTGATAYLTNNELTRVDIFTANAIMALAYFGNNLN